MAGFYEIHDSKLKKIAWDGDQAQITLSAVIIVADGEKMLRSGWQLIQLNLNQAIMTGDPVNSEVWLYEGTFVAETEDSHPEDRGDGCIAASLKHATGVHLHLFGHAEDANEYPTFDIRGQSMTLKTLSTIGWEII
jgi:hypothetical protein